MVRNHAPQQTIALAMIVRDEAEVIERCIDSTRGLISAWVICDTGSTDGTPEVIAAALGDLPGAVHRRPWKDFGHNRSELMELAADAADYLLLLDADQTVEQLGPLPELTADSYLLRHSGIIDYAVPRLVKADRGWRYVGATHEYLAADGPIDQQEMPALVVHHFADGGARSDKLERDRRLLEAELERDPENQRATFYLAQTMKEAGEPEAAIDLYRRRVELGGWDEEVFYAAFQVAVVTAQEDPEAAIGLHLDAFERRPMRAEPLHQLAYLSRIAGRYRATCMFARQGLKISYPADKLFVHRDTYEWGLLFELSIAAYWIGEREEGLAACEELLAKPDLPTVIREAVQRNRLIYTGEVPPDLPPAVQGATPLATLIDLRVAEIKLEVEPPWPSFNPSIAADGDGYRAIVRTASYEVTEAGWYRAVSDELKVQTLNYLAHFDASLALAGAEPIVDASEGPQLHESHVEGYEDMRLVEVAGRWYALATVRDRHPETLAQVILLTLEGARIEAATLLEGPTPGLPEKNWMPYAEGDRLRIVYSCGPTVILDCDPQTGALEELSRHDAPPAAERLRGGSQGVEVEGGRLFVVHDVVFFDADRRAYGHRFVLIDDEGRLTAASPRFSFAGERIELCAGMARQGDQLVISYGVWDRSAHLAVCSLADVRNVLKPAKDRLG